MTGNPECMAIGYSTPGYVLFDARIWNMSVCCFCC